MKAIVGKINTVTEGIIEKGVILIENGKIKAVGENLDIPSGTEVIEVPAGGVATPGFIDVHSHASVFGEPGTRPGLQADGNEIVDPLTPQLSVKDALNPRDMSIELVRNAGFTTLYILPGSANLIGGQGSAIKLRGNTAKEMIIPGTEHMKFAFGENPKNVYGQKIKQPYTRMAAAAMIREILTKAKEYGNKKKVATAENTPDKMPEYNDKYEALQPVINGQMKARMHAHRQDDIMTAVNIAQEFNMDFSIEHCTEGHFIKDELAKEKVHVVLGPFLMGLYKQEVWNASLAGAGELEKAGVDFCIMMDTGTDTRHLPTIIGMLIREGLSPERALEAVTIRPAKHMGLGDKLGSLEVGKDADISIFNGDPFSNYTHCMMTMIDGNVLYSREG